MKHKEDTWGWMLAVDFFFAGMGGGMLLISGVLDIVLGIENISVLAAILAPIFISLGAFLLILELGRPMQAWRVFVNPKAILTFGAWFMLLAIGLGILYASFFFDIFAWAEWQLVRKIIAVASGICGLIVAVYPGFLLGQHKARPFWTGPGMMMLFLLSSIVTAAAAHLSASLVIPPETMPGMTNLRWLTGVLLAIQLIFWPAYIWVKLSGSTEREALAAQKWSKGKYALYFWVGILLLGSLTPLICFGFSNPITIGIGAILVIAGGVLMRNMVVYSGADRTWLPGEEKYRAKLPKGDEPFLNAW